MIRRISAHVMNILTTKHFNFGWLSLTNFVTLRKPTMVSVFLNLNICYAEIPGPALDAMRTFNICKLIRTLFCAHIWHAYWIRFTLEFSQLSKRWIVVKDTNVTQHGRSTDFNTQETCSSCDMKNFKYRWSLVRPMSF